MDSTCETGCFARSSRLVLAAFVILSTSVCGQDQLRTWGSRAAMDSEAFRVPALCVSSCFDRCQAVVLTLDGRLLAVGDNGDGGAVPPVAPPGCAYTHVAATGVKVAALDTGQLVQWTSFSVGSSPPTSPPSLPPGMSWTQLASTSFRAFALRSDGVIQSWGTTFAGIESVPSLAAGLQYTSVSGSSYFAVATVSDGSVRVWGLNVFNVQSIPSLPSGLAYTKIKAGSNHVLALRSDGQVLAWGDNYHGQITVPSLPAGVTFVDVVAGAGHSLALRSDGQVVAWGLNNHGQCNLPTLPLGSIANLAAGFHHSIGVRSDGLVKIWGYWSTPPPLAPGVTYRELDATGDGALVRSSDGSLVPLLSFSATAAPALPVGVDHASTSAGFDFWLSLGTDGQVRAWGSNSWGQLVVPPLPGGVVYIKIDAGSQSGAALRSNGTVVGWGQNVFGQNLIPPLLSGQAYVDLAVGQHNVLLVRSDGSLVITGLMTTGAAAYLPALPPGRRAVDVACGHSIAAAILDDGSIVSWGSSTPIVPSLPTGLTYVEVDCGLGHAIARRSDGLVVTWGNPAQATPVPVPGPGRSFLRIAAALEASAGLIGLTSRYVPIGSGCAGTMPASRLIPRDTPQVGRTLSIAVTNLPVDVAFVAFGWSASPAPILLDGVGMPGCAAHISIDTMVGVAGSGGRAMLHMPIPMQSSLRGVQFVNQALVLDPTAGNAMNAVVSEAMAGLVGG